MINMSCRKGTGKRMEKKRTILYITQGDISGYPVHEQYSVKGKGRVVRVLTWTRGNKDYDLFPPFKSSARLYWNYTPTIRYTWLDAGFNVSAYERYEEQSNSIYIAPWDNIVN